jgi:hypothetical protein
MNQQKVETVKTESEMFGTLRTETRSPNVFLILLHKYKIQEKIQQANPLTSNLSFNCNSETIRTVNLAGQQNQT